MFKIMQFNLLDIILIKFLLWFIKSKSFQKLGNKMFDAVKKKKKKDEKRETMQYRTLMPKRSRVPNPPN